MKRSKVLICLTLVLMILFACAVPAFAQSNIKRDFYTTKKYQYIDKKYNGIMRYQVYYCKDSAGKKDTGTIYYTKDLLTPVMSHTKGKSGKTVSAQYTTEISWSKTKSWNESIGISVGIDGVVSASAEANCGTSKGWTLSKSVAKSYTLTESDFKNAPTGQYAIAAGNPQYKMYWKKYNSITENLKGSSYFYMPYGRAVTATIYSTDNQQTWKFYS